MKNVTPDTTWTCGGRQRLADAEGAGRAGAQVDRRQARVPDDPGHEGAGADVEHLELGRVRIPRTQPVGAPVDHEPPVFEARRTRLPVRRPQAPAVCPDGAARHLGGRTGESTGRAARRGGIRGRRARRGVIGNRGGGGGRRGRGRRVAREPPGRELPHTLALGDGDELVRHTRPEAQIVLGRHPRRRRVQLEGAVGAGGLGQHPDEERHARHDAHVGEGRAGPVSKVPAVLTLRSIVALPGYPMTPATTA